MAENTETRATILGCLERRMIGQIVLKWDQFELEQNKTQTTPSKEYLNAMHSLIKRIAQLQSAHEQPQGPITDPEILLPLVLQEAETVLKQLPIAGSNRSNPEPPLFTPVYWKQPVQPIRTVASWLLWSIAQTTHDTMQLLEGVSAQVSADRQIWHSGIVRLAACVEVKTDLTPFSLDLVTFQAVPSGLPEACFVQLQSSLLGQQTTSVKALLQRLAPQLITTAPILQPFLAGFAVELLVPQQAWQTGQITLQLMLEFVPTESLPDWTTAALDPLPTIKFTDPEWLEQHITTVVEAQLTQVLVQQRQVAPQIVEEGHIEVVEAKKTEQLLSIVRQGCAAIDQLQRSLTLASRTLAQQVFSLEELGLRLLWGMNRTAYEVMQWFSGVPVHLLQPQQSWTTGTLRFGVYLVLRTPQQTWCFDLVQRRLSAVGEAIPETAVVQLCGQEGESGSAQIILLSDLASKIWQQVSQITPEILLLRSETEVNVTIANSSGQLGIIQLQTAFEFSASGNFREA